MIRIIAALSIIFTLSCTKKIKVDDKIKTFVFDFDHTIHGASDMFSILVAKHAANWDQEKLDGMLNLAIRESIFGTKPEIIIQKIKNNYGVEIKKSDLEYAENEIIDNITPGILNIMKKIKNSGHRVIVIGGGPLGCGIIPQVVAEANIKAHDVYSGYMTGFDTESLSKAALQRFRFVNCGNQDTPLPKSKKKSVLIRHLKEQKIITNYVVHVGDGDNDLEVWKAGEASIFIGFGVNRVSPKVESGAPIFVRNMNDFSSEINEVIKKR